MKYRQIIFTGHSIQRIFEREIDPETIEAAIRFGEIIEEYPDDKPYPSFLILNFIAGKAIHVVCSFDKETETVYLITAYFPDLNIWDNNFKTRRTK
jgi:hypothetical protein